MRSTPDFITYAMTLMTTEASTGFFACVPTPEPDFHAALAFLRQRPLDTFMHRHVLGLICRLPLEAVQGLRDRIGDAGPLFHALVREASLEASHLAALAEDLDAWPAACSPLITLRAAAQPDHAVHQTWNRLLAANLSAHSLLPDPEIAPRPFPFPPETVADPGGVYITQILADLPDRPRASPPRPSAAQTAAMALDKLAALNILEGREMRHQSALSPYGLLHKWRLDLKVDCGRHRYTLCGLQTAYGRGLTLPDARASYAMEIVERCSSFANVAADRVTGYQKEHRIHYGALSALREGAVAPVDPNAFGVDAPYQDEPLHWIEGIRTTASGDEPVLVPVQSIFLFSNLDEVDLYAGQGSTGLASGNSLAEAKLSALMELVERDGEATHPFHHASCFQVEARDAKLSALLEDYRGRGIQYQFQDISPPYGIPCCKCFVTDMDGRIAKGSAASLDGGRAVLSALTETPFPYPCGPPSGPGLRQLPRLLFEELPNYASNDVQTDLALVERLFSANGLAPVYVDLTRQDLGIPVVRALLPGFALTADLDSHSRVHPRLFGNYLKIFGKGLA
jgi:ribosomal protein S12 methylthiotransferase accessory factor